jgi:mycothiol synthase
VHSEHVVRNYRPADFEVLLRLKNMSAALAADGVYLSPQALRNLLGRPNYVPKQDLFVAEIAGNVAGYLDINAEIRIGRAVFEVLVLPEYRQRGIASELYREAAPRAKATGANVAHVNVCEDNTIGRLVLEKTGFSIIRRFCEMTVDLTGTTEPGISTGFTVRLFRKGEEASIARLQNRCFAGSWGYNPNTTEEIEYAVNATGNNHELIFIATDGDRSVGYQWMNIEQDEHGKKRGRVSMLGVDPEYRGKGIGQELMQAGLACLKGRGLQIARLTVDSENVAANALYHSIGFSKSETSLWYEKVLDR